MSDKLKKNLNLTATSLKMKKQFSVKEELSNPKARISYIFQQFRICRCWVTFQHDHLKQSVLYIYIFGNSFFYRIPAHELTRKLVLKSIFLHYSQIPYSPMINVECSFKTNSSLYKMKLKKNGSSCTPAQYFSIRC